MAKTLTHGFFSDTACKRDITFHTSFRDHGILYAKLQVVLHLASSLPTKYKIRLVVTNTDKNAFHDFGLYARETTDTFSDLTNTLTRVNFFL